VGIPPRAVQDRHPEQGSAQFGAAGSGERNPEVSDVQGAQGARDQAVMVPPALPSS
jgi:hypothetical protein